jgi:hypothetical protein
MSSLADRAALQAIPCPREPASLHRYANSRKLKNLLDGLGATPSEIPVFLNYMGRHGLASAPDALISGPFSHVNRKSSAQKGRFDADDFPAFYAALDEQTAAAEVAHYMSHPHPPRALHYHKEYLTCDFLGHVRDVTSNLTIWPFLTGTTTAEYADCLQLARWAVALDTDAFFTPSARNPAGTCCPVFNKDCLSPSTVAVVKVLVFEYDASGTLIQTYEAP